VIGTLAGELPLDSGEKECELPGDQKDAILGQMLADRLREPLEDMISRLVLELTSSSLILL
jgi:hypothetical protein